MQVSQGSIVLHHGSLAVELHADGQRVPTLISRREKFRSGIVRDFPSSRVLIGKRYK